MDLIELLQHLQTTHASLGQTESDTRAQIIDPILSALGWPTEAIAREPFVGWSESRGFIDYLLSIKGRPFLVLEAKKTGRTFDLPQALVDQKVTTYKKLAAVANADLKEAIEQCLKYTQFTGAQYACATNGIDWIIFKAIHPIRPLNEAKIIIFHGIDSILADLDLFCEVLGKHSIELGSADKHLMGRPLRTPVFAMRLRDRFPFPNDNNIEVREYASLLDQLLQFYAEDLQDEQAFKDCYVPVNANRNAETLIDSIISNQLPSESSIREISQESFPQVLLGEPPLVGKPAGRLIVLHGGLGIGKSSFLRSCKSKVMGPQKRQGVVWGQVNLVSFEDRTFDSDSRKEMLQLICRELQNSVSESADSLQGNYNPDKWDHLRDIYSKEMKKFRDSLFPNSHDDDLEYLKEARKYVWELKERDPQDHLIRLIKWLSMNCSLQVVLVLDNSDQLGLEFQEFLYKLAESIQQQTSAVTVLVIRTEALVSHRIRAHSLASVHEQFAIQQAPLSVVLQKRINAMYQAIKKVSTANNPKLPIVIDRLLTFLDVLQYETQIGSEAFGILDCAGNGTLRFGLEAVSAVFRDSPKRMDKLVADQYRKPQVRLRSDHVLQAILKYNNYKSDKKPLIPNIFSTDASIIIPHSLGIRLLQQVHGKTATTGQYFLKDLYIDFAMAGMEVELIQRVVKRLIQDKLLSVPHMFDDPRDVDPIKLTHLGKGLLSNILIQHVYYEHYAFEAVIYDEQKYIDMRSIWNSGGEAWKRFRALGASFLHMVQDDDLALRRESFLSNLEPALAVDFPFPSFEL